MGLAIFLHEAIQAITNLFIALGVTIEMEKVKSHGQN